MEGSRPYLARHNSSYEAAGLQNDRTLSQNWSMRHTDEQIAAEAMTLENRGVAAVTESFERDQHRLRLFIKHRTDERILGRLDWDDVLQETFIVLQSRYRDFVAKPTVPFYVWMRSIAGQVMIDLHRKHLGTKKRSIEREISIHRKLPFQSTAVSLGTLLAASGTSPSNVAIRGEQFTTLNAKLQSMDEIDREILILRHMEQLTNDEIAHVLDISKSAATKRYIRALQRLRQRLDTTPET